MKPVNPYYANRKRSTKISKRASSDEDEQKEIYTIEIANQEMVVHYNPHYLKNYLAHIEFHSPYEPARRIPVSETGYRSHFVAPQDLEAFPSIQEYAHLLALAIISDKGCQPDDEEDDEQMLLF